MRNIPFIASVRFASFFFFGIGVLTFTSARSQESDLDPCYEAGRILSVAQEYHHDLPALDSSFEKLFMDAWIERLDPEGHVFRKGDLKRIKKHQEGIMDLVKKGDCSFLEDVTGIYKERVKEVRAFLNGISGEDLSFEGNDTLWVYTRGRSTHYYGEKSYKDRWERRLEYRVLSSYATRSEKEGFIKDTFQKKLPELLKEVKEQTLCRLRGAASGTPPAEKVQRSFLKALAASFDPHSSYFTPSDKRGFESQLSTEAPSFGLRVQFNERREVMVKKVLPGSPAWKTNRLDPGDVLLSIDPEGEEPHDLLCVDLDKVRDILHDPEIQKAVFRVRKEDGERVSVPLHKKKVEMSSNKVDSYLLKGSEFRAGYIHLPSFYTRMEKKGVLAKGCANDLSRSIIKLKQKGIEGLVLDLRRNSGGSMKEAVQVAGTFVDKGDISVVQRKGEKGAPIKDPHRGTSFEKPLLILVDHFSASASELVAGALKARNRALIVGTPTYGKATAQRVFPLADSTASDPRAKGFLRLTIGQFLHVDSNSHQNIGVKPHIKLPHPLKASKVGEEVHPHSLEPASVRINTYYKELPPLPVKKLQRKSQQRVREDSLFQRIQRSKAERASGKEAHPIPLRGETFFDEGTDVDGEDEKNEDDTEASPFEIESLDPMAKMGMLDEEEEQVHEQALQNIREDPYVQEAYFLLQDLVQLKSP